MIGLLLRASGFLVTIAVLLVSGFVWMAQQTSGEQLAVVIGWTSGRDSSLQLIDLERGAYLELNQRLPDLINPNHLAWSPDGRYLAFSAVSLQANTVDVYVIDFTTMRIHQQTALGFITHYPTWSPDGEEIAFVSIYQGVSTIHAMPALGGNPTRPPTLTDSPGLRDARDLHWSPDGESMLFTDFDGRGIMAFNRDSRQHNILLRSASAQDPRYAPTGTQISYVHASMQSRDRLGIFITDINGGPINELRLGDTRFSPSSPPVWTPDATRIVFAAVHPYDANIRSINSIDIESGSVRTHERLPYQSFPVSLAWRPR